MKTNIEYNYNICMYVPVYAYNTTEAKCELKYLSGLRLQVKVNLRLKYAQPPKTTRKSEEHVLKICLKK